jgi:hypothetical protein
MNLDQIYTDSLDVIAEEIRLYMGLNTEVTGNKIQVDTIAGKINFIPSETTVMGNVYRFISNSIFIFFLL